MDFRIQSGTMMAVLTRLLGRSRWEVCEEIVQETLLKAFQVWSMHGEPDNPEGWLVTTARNKAIDWLRAESRAQRGYRDLQREHDIQEGLMDGAPPLVESNIHDDQLRMLFACCDPRLAASDGVALTLKLVCGLSHAEISAALSLQEEAVRKRLFRARERLKLAGFDPEEVSNDDILPRAQSVHQVIYLMFNEGYKSHSQLNPIRFELCEEALRLAFSLRELLPGSHETDALLALMCFQMARFPTRTYSDGSICQLQFQDRSLWDQRYLRRGFEFFLSSAGGRTLSRFHLEAAIASHHAAAPRFEDTDWKAIALLYDRLGTVSPSPFVALNRAIAIGFSEDPCRALEELDRLAGSDLEEYSLYHATFGEFYGQLGRVEDARRSLDRAIVLCASSSERALLERRRATLKALAST